MSTVSDKVLDEALALPADARLGLVEQLLASLNLPLSGEIEQQWAEEAEKRVGEIDSGKVQPIAGEEVFARLRKKYGK